MTRVLGLLGVGLLASALTAQDARRTPAAPDREPTPVETQILELMNRLRAKPHAEADLIPPKEGVDWKMFREEMMALSPAPPLVFNLDLLDAARHHSHYMTLNGQSHDEDPAKAGFTGVNGGDRIKKTGYAGLGWGENIFNDVESAWYSHQGFVVDWGPGGTGGMQATRGHRKNMMNPEFREVGPGVVAVGKGISVTHNLSSRKIRMAGGVIYRDANGNRFYDPGEGVGSVALTASDGRSCASWKSGAYALELATNDEVTITASVGGLSYSRKFPAGSDNVKFDVMVPDPAAVKKVDKVLDEAAKTKDVASSGYYKAAVGLYVASRGLSLDDGRRARAEEITREVAPKIEAAQRTVQEAMKDAEATVLKKVIEDQRKPFKGTEADLWFQDAETVAKLMRGLSMFQKQAAAASEKEKKQFVSVLEQEGSHLKTSAFKQELETLVARARNLK
jgi:hypothetical protein